MMKDKEIYSEGLVSLTKLSYNVDSLPRNLPVTREYNDWFPPVGSNILKVFDVPHGVVIVIKYSFNAEDIEDEENPMVTITSVKVNLCDNQLNLVNPPDVDVFLTLAEDIQELVDRYYRVVFNSINMSISTLHKLKQVEDIMYG